MKIVLISGLSGSGKSVALKQLEDLGYYCVDNLPLEMLPSLVSLHIERADETKLGVSVDIRSGINIQEAQEQIQYLRHEGHQVEVLFIEAEEGVLVRRFSETRRGHPLSGQNLTLLESLQKEREWLFPLRDIAYCIDTSKMNAQQLRYAVQQWLNIERVGLLVILESFGFKYGVPNNADFMFDMRSLPNPYYDPELRPFTGMDKPIQDYLGQQPLVQEMVDDIDHFISRWLPRLQQESRSYVTIAIGCTGGQHRSVYVVENWPNASRAVTNSLSAIVRLKAWQDANLPFQTASKEETMKKISLTALSLLILTACATEPVTCLPLASYRREPKLKFPAKSIPANHKFKMEPNVAIHPKRLSNVWMKQVTIATSMATSKS